MKFKINYTTPKSQIEGWNGTISVDNGATWHRLTKYVGGGLVSFDSKEQMVKEAKRLARRLGGQ
jgi:hypothetical protein